jgi:hypothetical protein
MINFKKGPALSLHQVNYVGSPATSDITAGMIVRVTQTGSGNTTVTKGNATLNDSTTLLGFAINSAGMGDAIESGKIGVYALDGGSVIETDQIESSINLNTIAAGTPLTASANSGLVAQWATGNRLIGWVEGVRALPGKENQTTTVTLTDPVTGATRTRSFSYQPNSVNVLAIKLAS